MEALAQDVQLCWLARAAAQALGLASGRCGASGAHFAAVGGSGGELETARRLAQLVRVFVEDGSLAAEADAVAVASSFEALPGLLPDEKDGGKWCLVVVASEEWKGDAVESLVSAGIQVVLVISEKRQHRDGVDWMWGCSLHSLSDSPIDKDTLLRAHRSLDRLLSSCGWRIALEVFSWIMPTTEENADSLEIREPLFSSSGQLPFQLLLILLRWTYCHPQVAHEVGKKVRRQLELAPSRRTQRDVVDILKLGLRIWESKYSLESIQFCVPVRKPSRSSAARLEAAPSSPGSRLARLSKCQLWDAQKQFYLDRGISAWSAGTVPFGVSSSSFIAAIYARVAVDFLLSRNLNSSTPTSSVEGERVPNCFVWEAASGSCKFLHHFLLHFGNEIAKRRADFKRLGLVPLVVASDLSDDVLESRMGMACFRPYLERGLLEFARFDTADFVSGTSKGLLQLKHSNRTWMPGSDGPVFLMGNYFFDSLRTDVFMLTASAEDLSAGQCTVREALIENTTLSIAEMELVFSEPFAASIHSSTSIFDSSVANTVFNRIINEFISKNGQEEMSSLILFPTEAIAFLSVIVSNAKSGAMQHSVAVLAGDAGFSFREAIPSAFLATRECGSATDLPASLELPQLSPHPDCFCLPVDFELFQLTFDGLAKCIFDSSSASKSHALTQTVTTPASDTFDVFYATIGNKTDLEKSHASFCHELETFTPGDCDLLWGLLGVDDGAKHFSACTQLALLAQTMWDFDLFAVVQWPLAAQYKANPNKIDRLQLIDAGVRSWRTYYQLEDFDKHSPDHRADSRIVLQVARWFFVLEAYDHVVAVLSSRVFAATDDKGEVEAYYLLGLATSRLSDHWKALALFRTCARSIPTRLKYQLRVNDTLLSIQHLRCESS